MNIGPSHIFRRRNFHTIIILFLYTIGFYGCNKPLEVKGFDAQSWKSDKKACQNSRIAQEKVIIAAKDKLIGSAQEDIIQFLGRPEKQELYTRGQKFYIYYLSPSSECDESIDSTIPSRLLYVRFSALNKVNEVFVQQL